MRRTFATQIWMRDHIEQMQQEAKQARVLRSARYPGESPRRVRSVKQVFGSLLALFAQRRVARGVMSQQVYNTREV